MRTEYPKFFISFIAGTALTWMISCSGRSGTEKADKVPAPVIENSRSVVKILSPLENAGFKLREPVKVVLSVEKKPDSIVIMFDSRHVSTLTNEPWESNIPSEFTLSTGKKALKVTSFESGKKPSTLTRFLVVYSDVAPKKYGYSIVHTYPHDRDAFTQGLFYYNGILYEGTGQQTGSSLREVQLETGKVLRQHNLDASLFGEGITLYNDRIFQVTWENKVGFVYDRASFNVINKIYYPTQGWGLTTIGNKIVMSDGTNVLYFYEPESFTVISRIEVYDDVNIVDSLNELEYINGEIWANIWMTDRIARIDPETGKVKGYIDLTGLLKKSDKETDTDVLNGIAWDSAGKRIFVTGKRWPKLFEITLRE
ncbi:MAG TPA: glutaminyl-peptide cyclotransferase [Bacteroidales bacterium]|nr:glutaminyl-peptide cyclotransferase [Bacteroidales bacterium]